MRILTTIRWPGIWDELSRDLGVAIDMVPSNTARTTRLGTWLAEIRLGVVLWHRARRYDAVITGTEPHVAVFGALLRLRFQRRLRHLLLDCYWERSAGVAQRLAKSLECRAMVTPWSRAVVYARHEVQSFARYFGIPPRRFVFIPYHTTLSGHRVPVSRVRPADYLFTGGSSQRDYRTLFRAVDGLPIRAIVAVGDRSTLPSPIPANVDVVSTDHAGFLQYQADAMVNVVPLVAGSLRSAGHQTFLNAMALGTPVIVTDDHGGRDYIDHMADGVLTPAGDSEALRRAILTLVDKPDLRAAIGRAASRVREPRSTTTIARNYVEFLCSAAFDDPDCLERVEAA